MRNIRAVNRIVMEFLYDSYLDNALAVGSDRLDILKEFAEEHCFNVEQRTEIKDLVNILWRAQTHRHDGDLALGQRMVRLAIGLHGAEKGLAL